MYLVCAHSIGYRYSSFLCSVSTKKSVYISGHRVVARHQNRQKVPLDPWFLLSPMRTSHEEGTDGTASTMTSGGSSTMTSGGSSTMTSWGSSKGLGPGSSRVSRATAAWHASHRTRSQEESRGAHLKV